MRISTIACSSRSGPPALAADQAGVMIIEAMVAMIIFAIGILGLVGLQARMNTAVIESKYRAEAALLADELIGTMWSDAHGGPWNTSASPAYADNIPAYAHRATGGDCTAGFTGADSANANVVKWLGSASAKGSVFNLLPSMAADRVQITVNANFVNITLCWQTPSDPLNRWHQYQTSAVIRG